LQNKLVAYTTGLIVLLSLSFSSYLFSRQRQLLSTALERRGETIASSIANNCQFSVLADDKTNLANFVNSATKENDVVTMAIMDKNGKFLAHTDPAKIDQDATSESEKKALTGKNIDRAADGNLIVISIPIESKMSKNKNRSADALDVESMIGLTGTISSNNETQDNQNAPKELIGYVQVTLSTNGIRNELKLIRRNIYILTLGIIVFGILIITILSHHTFAPLKIIVKKIQKISQGEIEESIKKCNNDEIGDLARAFNEMVLYVDETSRSARLIAQGELYAEIKPRSENDALGNSFKEMILYLQEMAKLLQDIAQGKLTSSITPRSAKDMIGTSLSSMLKGLRTLIAQIQESSNQIHSRANEMASLSSVSSETVSQMASNINQISVSINKISNSTQTVANVAKKAAETAEGGDDTIREIIERVSRSKESAYQAVELIKNLGKCSMQIGEIIDYITKVADQTNLLSLNAAIEAARAGEAGRGFAVVADEVRKLAEGSAQSASEISRLIREVQSETTKVVKSVETLAIEVGDSASVTQEAGKSFRDISQAAKNIAAQIEEIAASYEETAANTQEVSASSEEQVATFEEISASTENLKSIAENLKSAASEFKLK